jgi:hypothetical protein
MKGINRTRIHPSIGNAPQYFREDDYFIDSERHKWGMSYP